MWQVNIHGGALAFGTEVPDDQVALRDESYGIARISVKQILRQVTVEFVLTEFVEDWKFGRMPAEPPLETPVDVGDLESEGAALLARPR